MKPRVGTLFTNFLGRSFSIYDVVTTFRDHQPQGLSMLGISVDKGSRTFNLVFREDGRPYSEPSGNRAKFGTETVTEKPTGQISDSDNASRKETQVVL